jgi:hypothetical protein
MGEGVRVAVVSDPVFIEVLLRMGVVWQFPNILLGWFGSGGVVLGT